MIEDEEKKNEKERKYEVPDLVNVPSSDFLWRKGETEMKGGGLICEEVAMMIFEGESPREVASHFPCWFILHHEGTVRLWEIVNRRTWRANE